METRVAVTVPLALVAVPSTLTESSFERSEQLPPSYAVPYYAPAPYYAPYYTPYYYAPRYWGPVVCAGGWGRHGGGRICL